MDRGTKRRCPHCGAPFYDLNRHPILCPRCGEEVRPEAPARIPARGRIRPSPPVIEAAEDAGSLTEDEDVEAADDRDDEDDDNLGGGVSDDDQDDLRD